MLQRSVGNLKNTSCKLTVKELSKKHVQWIMSKRNYQSSSGYQNTGIPFFIISLSVIMNLMIKFSILCQVNIMCICKNFNCFNMDKMKNISQNRIHFIL